MTPELRALEARANVAIGRLDGITRLLPDPDLFVYMYVRKEAVLSSQIEGTQSSLSDLLLFEHEGAPHMPTDDVKEVSRYVAAQERGIKLLKTIPLSMRLLKELHSVLLKGSRGGDKAPGELRTSQNWIGGSKPGDAHYVPPPSHQVLELLTNFEKFLHDEPEKTPSLIKAALAHAQFETIHPFLDGNGRIGRLLIPLILLSEGVLSSPTLYVSLHFKEQRGEYYNRLQRIRTHGEWEHWISFFLEGIVHVAESACATITKLTELFRRHRALIEAKAGRSAGNALRVYDLAREMGIISIPETSRKLSLTQPTIAAAISTLEELRILVEFTGKQRDRRFWYKSYISQLADRPLPND